ncbi:autotransporter outer membrane beta-barrel domain-containing protein [Brachyspira hampsonii]|uniref:Uncharacterized protein n=1 Tax=Brachyspira hampsonii TaxID=1287055 RepID=A0AAC9TSH6_9SPIR|nr:autotransporter outer membrane beta-barrel domain-containing protein [Brachyspira hampsonii]ASJ21138.1 hypothetical protein BHAMNSH16_05535 [Brachyspira hampsonii]ELV06850.1 hypothetical protein H263_01875 [Brachyspira hampsonii 30599]MBW5380388.1 autotransporter outer membrane beta-barrel domain-containing protein [Brachyspira hampsonii]OEJ16775.1 hypothetical protein A9496_00405 [Brachyspira hampsonii]
MNIKKIIIFTSVLIFTSGTIINAQDYLKHSLGIDFGTTLFSMGTIPLITELIFKTQEGASGKFYDGKFGIRLTYNYTYLPKQSIDATLGFYAFDTHYSDYSEPVRNSAGDIIASAALNKFYNGSTIAIPASIGVRFYLNKNDTPSGFFLLPKVGMTTFIVNGKELRDDGTTRYKTTTVYDFYISGEMGFRIDLFSKTGSNWEVRPFIDISLLDIGYSFTPGIRLIPLPRLAIGISF